MRIAGAAGNLGEVNPTFKALRSALYPADAVGRFRASMRSPLFTNFTSNTAAWILHNPIASPISVVIESLFVQAQVVTPFTTAQEITFYFSIARGGATFNTTTATVANVVGNGKLKKRASGSGSFARMRMNSAASSGLSVSGTLDSQPICGVAGWSQSSATAPMPPIAGAWDFRGEAPVVLAPGEEIRCICLGLGVTGTVRANIAAGWLEVASDLLAALP